jgi:hypothetical protein
VESLLAQTSTLENKVALALDELANKRFAVISSLVYKLAIHDINTPQSLVRKPWFGILALIHLHPSGASGVPVSILFNLLNVSGK